MNSKPVATSFDNLLSNRGYVSTFYLTGTLIIGVLAEFLERNGTKYESILLFVTLLVIPLHLIVYWCKHFATQLVDSKIPTLLARLFGNSELKPIVRNVACHVLLYGLLAVATGIIMLVMEAFIITRGNPAFEWLLITWLVVTAILIGLLIYRSTLIADGELLSRSTELHGQQSEGGYRVTKLDPYVRILEASSGAVVLLILGLLIYVREL